MIDTRRTRLVITGNWHQFCNWARQDEFGAKNAVYVLDFSDLAGRDREQVELIRYGEWYKNQVAIEAVSRWLGISPDSIIKNWEKDDNLPLPPEPKENK